MEVLKEIDQSRGEVCDEELENQRQQHIIAIEFSGRPLV